MSSVLRVRLRINPNEPILLCLVLCGLIGGIPASAAETQQTTTGANSPAIVGNDNKVTFNDIDARAVKRLNDLLDEKDLTIAQKVAEAEEWARKYRELGTQFTARSQAKGDDATQIKAAQDLLHEGKLEDAGKIYDQLLSHDESNIDRAALHFSRAQIYALQFRPLDALPHYAKAYQYRPDRVEYAAEYARILANQNEYKKAESVLDGLLPQVRDLAVRNPAAYRQSLAETLNIFASIYVHTKRIDDAESALKEAVAIQRDLAAQSPAAHRPALAITVASLGIVYELADRVGDAESAFKEALAIYRDLVAQNPAYRPYLGVTFAALGTMYVGTGRMGEGESALKEAVAIGRDLAAQNPAAYRSNLAPMLGALGIVYGLAQRFGEAESALKEDVAIQREVAARNPAGRPELAQDLTNLARVYSSTHRFGEAESALEEGCGHPARSRGSEPHCLPTRPGAGPQISGGPLPRNPSAGRSQGGRGRNIEKCLEVVSCQA
jgi:tetratricopeptide (TPR) repeat protein